MDNIAALAAATDHERIAIAHRMTPDEKLSAGIVLFEWECGVARAEISRDNPSAKAAEVERTLAERLRQKQLAEMGTWHPRR